MKNRPCHIHLPALLCLCILAFSCRKFIDKQKEQVVRNFITDGYWRVTGYSSGDSDITSQFSGYQFRFHDDGTVDGLLGAQRIAGTWSADIIAKTIISAFPAGSVPVDRLNYTWKIADSYTDSVSAFAMQDSSILRLQLHKD